MRCVVSKFGYPVITHMSMNTHIVYRVFRGYIADTYMLDIKDGDSEISVIICRKRLEEVPEKEYADGFMTLIHNGTSTKLHKRLSDWISSDIPDILACIEALKLAELLQE